MIVNPKSKSITYGIDKLENVELCLEEIEKTSLESDGVSGMAARDILGMLEIIRMNLCLKQGVKRHPKFAPENQD